MSPLYVQPSLALQGFETWKHFVEWGYAHPDHRFWVSKDLRQRRQWWVTFDSSFCRIPSICLDQTAWILEWPISNPCQAIKRHQRSWDATPSLEQHSMSPQRFSTAKSLSKGKSVIHPLGIIFIRPAAVFIHVTLCFPFFFFPAQTCGLWAASFTSSVLGSCRSGAGRLNSSLLILCTDAIYVIITLTTHFVIVFCQHA